MSSEVMRALASPKEKLIAEALKLVEKGQYERAVKVYLKVVADDGRDVRIWLKIGDLYSKLRRNHEAAETYERVAQFYSDQGFYTKAIAVYKQILKLDPALVAVHERLADIYRQMGLLPDAIEQFQAVANHHHVRGDLRSALEAMKQMVELDPQNVASRVKLAELYSKENMGREATEEFARAAEFLYEQERYDDYMKVAERLLFHSPDNRPVSRELARLYLLKGDPRRALPRLQVCFKADPRDTETLNLLADAFESLGQRAKAVSVLKELGRIHAENGAGYDREVAYQRILELEPGDPEALSVLQERRSASANGLHRRPGDSNPALRAQVRQSQPRLIADPRPGPASQPQLRSGPLAGPAAGLGAGPGAGIGSPARDHVAPVAALPEVDTQEEVRQLLAETEVFLKYSLHAKAIEHLHAVLERAPNHLVAHEKLKALFFSMGRRTDGTMQLRRLATITAGTTASVTYLQELLQLDPGDAWALEQLTGSRPAPAPRASSFQPAAATHIPVEVDELSDIGGPDLYDPDPIEDEDLGAQPLEVVQASRHGEDVTLDLGFDEIEEVDSREVHLEELESPGGGEAYAAALDTHRPRSAAHLDAPSSGPGYSAYAERSSALSRPPARDDDEPPTETAAAPADEEEFHLVVESPPTDNSSSATLPLDVEDRFGLDLGTVGVDGDVDDSYHPQSEEVLAEPAAIALGLPPPEADLGEVEDFDFDPSEMLANLDAPAASAPLGDGASGSAALPDDELEEIDFFIRQGMLDEAREALSALEEKHGPSEALAARLAELETMGLGGDPEQDAVPQPVPPRPEPASYSASGPLPTPGLPQGRRNVVEMGVGADDFESHFDLGIAYKEMGLLDEAIAEFTGVLRDSARQAQCHQMLGLCYLAKQRPADAIEHFKAGLGAPKISDEEALSLSYEIGRAHQQLGQHAEALAWFDRIRQRSTNYRDVSRLIRTSTASATPGFRSSANLGRK